MRRGPTMGTKRIVDVLPAFPPPPTACSSTDILRAFLNAVQSDSGFAQIASLDITYPVTLREIYEAQMEFLRDQASFEAPAREEGARRAAR